MDNTLTDLIKGDVPCDYPLDAELNQKLDLALHSISDRSACDSVS